MLTLSQTLMYYKRKDIGEEIVRQAKDKEVAFRFNDFFGKRPEILTYPADVLELAKQKMTSLHCSEELWKNPLQISTGMKKDDLTALRKGWDLVLDIDCHFFEYSRIAADLVVKALRENGVKAITAKFSGNKGFHIAVPFESFPKQVSGKPTSDLFPDAPRRIASYVTEMIREPLASEIMKLEQGSFERVIERTQLPASKITRYARNDMGDNIPSLNVDPFLEIDTLLISSRHLYRMPYSFHEKSGLISVPVDVDKILRFEKEQAKPEHVKVVHAFLDRGKSCGDGELLLRQAFDFKPVVEQEREEKIYEDTLPDVAIGEEHFPPCIKLMLQGVTDGRKRTVFALINLLSSCAWDYDTIEKRLMEWNERNTEPLRPVYILGQLRYARAQRKTTPPPNCNNPNYYTGLGVCKPDSFCQRIKNPLQYAKYKSEAAANTKPRKKPKAQAL